ncbi:MAG: right-handed parallel beta-helix repeat-containing protein [Candidatus Sumerlaeia bacterium]|nr:right-handed parallel beta-helix repeat-containing protein [Candidatus Sumerlaeia bacterium]
MRTVARLCFGLILTASAGQPGTAGPLAPPSAPAPTVNLAEPRTPVSSLPFVISTSGSYIVTSDLQGVAGQGGITITASDVALDLRGFSLTGVPGSSNGVTITGGAVNVVIRNGTVRSWAGDGINAELGQRVVVEDITSRSNGGDGFAGSVRITLRRCRFELNSLAGATVNSESLIENCTSTLNGGLGFAVGGPSVIRDSESTSNTGGGIFTTADCEILRCSVSGGAGNGIATGDRCTVSECRASGLTGNGITFGGNCSIVRNRVDGASNPGGATPAGLRTAGVRNRIEGNHITGSDVGLLVDGTQNMVRENLVQGNTANYQLLAGNQIEILLSEIPERIDWPCAIRLTGDLTGVAGSDGIDIHSRDVSIDLAGHALIGVPGAGAGIIHAPNGSGITVENLVIRNGSLRDWPGGGIAMPSTDGVRVEGVAVDGSGQEGIDLGARAHVRSCTVTGSAQTGIATGESAIVADCTAEGNQLHGIDVDDGSTVERCTARLNVEVGIRGGSHVTVRGCTGESNRLDNLAPGGDPRPAGTLNNGYGILVGEGGAIADCTAALNDVAGIRADTGSSILNCTSRLNDGLGFQAVASTLSGNSARENQSAGFFLFAGCTVNDSVASGNGNAGFAVVSGDVQFTGCTSHFNGGTGFDLGSGSHIRDSLASTNAGDGIVGGGNCRVIANHCEGNGNGASAGVGIRITGRESTIDGNTVTANDSGIVVSNTDNLIVRNTSTNHTGGNYGIAAGNDVGAIIALPGTGAFASTQPWANFER